VSLFRKFRGPVLAALAIAVADQVPKGYRQAVPRGLITSIDQPRFVRADQGGAATGPLAGTRLEDLPGSVKVPWRDWVRAHPDTLVLSVRGAEHVRDDPYAQYFSSRLGFGNLAAIDRRLPTKEPVWAFEHAGGRFAIPHRAIEGGGTLALGDLWLFFYRPPGASIFLSTRALASKGRFVFQDGAWVHEPTGAVFDAERGEFQGSAAGLEPLAGFDTFWYVWSLTHRDTELLGPAL